MNTTEQTTLEKIDFNKRSMVYPKDLSRPPVYGRFVNLGDAEQMLEKGYVRFVSESMVDRFNEVNDVRKVMFTRLLTLKDIREIKNY